MAEFLDSIGEVHVGEEDEQQECNTAPQDDPESRQQ
jgi:hypothetical protein